VALVGEIIDFFTTSESWTGRRGILPLAADHIRLSVLATTVAIVLALPPALYLGHIKRGSLLAINLVNIGRAMPSFGIVALALPISLRLGWGLGFWPTFVALVALALPPIFTNSYTAIAQVDPAVVEAAAGMGMTSSEVLFKTEVPLAVPVIWTAIRISAVQVVATATLGAVVGWGGLGRFIIDGFAQGNQVWLVAGGLLVAVLAVATDMAFAVTEKFVLPAGLAHRDRTELITQTAA
jgi:osmoprotectant transport system permease protein